MERHQPMNMTAQFYHHMETLKTYFSVSIYKDTVGVCYHVAGSNESGFNFFQWLSVNLHLLQKKKNSKPQKSFYCQLEILLPVQCCKTCVRINKLVNTFCGKILVSVLLY